MQEPQTNRSARTSTQPRVDAVILVYDGESRLGAMLMDVVKKAVGREECALCEITYSPVGKRGAWKQCEARLGVAVTEMHRDQLPEPWGIARTELPCILARSGGETPFMIASRDEIIACHGSVEALEAAVVTALGGREG